jgi:hypothetical protein
LIFLLGKFLRVSYFSVFNLFITYSFTMTKLHSHLSILRDSRKMGWLPNLNSKYHVSSYISLRSSLARIAIGSTVDLRTKLFDEQDRKILLTKLYKEVLLPHKLELDPVLYDLEDKETKLFGPYSIMAPYDVRKEGVLEYYNHQHPDSFQPNWKFLSKAVATVRALNPKGLLNSLNPIEANRRLPKSTNWGLPYIAKGSDANEDYLQDVLDALASNDTSSIFSKPCLLGWRGQPSGGPVPKQRVVWMYPHSVSILEKCICDPLVKSLTKRPTFHSWLGLDYVDKNITTIMDNIQNRNNKDCTLLLSIDFSGFDKRLHHLFINLAFDIIKYWFNEKDQSILSDIQQYFTHCKLVSPDGILDGVHGVPSGSGLTNVVDSILNLIAYHYLLLRGNFTDQGVMVQGDDGLYSISGFRSFNYKRILNFISNVLSELCLVLNTEKQFYTFYYHDTKVGIINGKDYHCTSLACHFLQRLHSNFARYEDGLYHGIRSVVRTFNGMLSHETIKRGWNKWFESIRFLMQLDNCYFHPLVSQFTEFLVSGDKFGLGRYIGGTSVLFANIGTPDDVIDKLGYRGFLYNFLSIDPKRPHAINLSIVKYVDRDVLTL